LSMLGRVSPSKGMIVFQPLPTNIEAEYSKEATAHGTIL
jgi:hypothetical protein